MRRREKSLTNSTKEIEEEFDIIASDKFLVQFHKDYDKLTRMYKIFKESYETGIKVNREFSRKTAELVREHTKGEDILEARRTYKIKEHTLQKIEESTDSEIEKVFNLVASTIIEIRIRLMYTPYLIPIGGRAENVTFSWLSTISLRQVLGHARIKKNKR